MWRREERRRGQRGSEGADALIIASKFDISAVFTPLLHFLAPSRPFVAFSQSIEPLARCKAELDAKQTAVHVRVTESFLREYQVLPMRTHPEMMTSATGGYLLTGFKVIAEE